MTSSKHISIASENKARAKANENALAGLGIILDLWYGLIR